jgi:hypothetical protein
MTRWILTDVTRSAYSNLISKNSKIALVVVALAGVCLGQQANAGTIVALPDAVWSGVNRAYGVGPPGNSCCVLGSYITITTAGTVSTSFTSFYGSLATGTVIGSPASQSSTLTIQPYLSATGVAGYNSGTALYDLLTYYIEVVGQSGPVILDFTSNGSVTTSDEAPSQANSEANLQINTAGGDAYADASSVAGVTTLSSGGNVAGAGTIITAGTAPGSFTTQGSITVQANEYIEILMSVTENTTIQSILESSDQPTGTGSASLDPYFYIDASTPDYSQYSIAISSGIGNISGVPEPSTWALTLLGFVGLSFASYRHRSHRAAHLV